MTDRRDVYERAHLAKNMLETWAVSPLDFDSIRGALEDDFAASARFRDGVKLTGLDNGDVEPVFRMLTYLIDLADGALVLVRDAVDLLVTHGVVPSREVGLKLVAGDIEAPAGPGQV